MRYGSVQIESIGYELAPIVVSSEELEARLEPVYRKVGMQVGQLELLTGIEERRFWEPDYPVSRGAAVAALKALQAANVPASAVEMLIYGGVCRQHFEPATAVHVAADLEAQGHSVSPRATILDVSNACLGVLNGMIEVANRIELGQIRAGLVVSCESSRDIIESTVADLLRDPDPNRFRLSLATLTGGSGAVAVLLTDGSFGHVGHRFFGGVQHAAPRHHDLCLWGVEPQESHPSRALGEAPVPLRQFMSTDAVSVLKHGVELAQETWDAFLPALDWKVEEIDRFVCHQVGSKHRETILRSLGIPTDRDFVAYPFLGNTGTVALPMALALAAERRFVSPGDRVALLGIGSGLSCMMLGLEW